MARKTATKDGNEVVAHVAHKVSEVIAIYPITPSSPMGEHADAWSADGTPNIWGSVPEVVEMQSEGGAAGAVHGALQAGALTTTFTASQGLLLMIPNLYKIAGELTPAVIHVAARSVAAQALSIFADHSDVMATRATGFALLASNSVQEAHDFALISHAATLRSRIPFLHFFDGFRVSHEVSKIAWLSDEDIGAMMDEDLVRAHRERALSPDNPFIRGTAQNPDVFFQARESVNPFYEACPDEVQATMDDLAGRTGRQYRLFDYVGAPDAERVIVIMGSGAETVDQTVRALAAEGDKVGVVKVRLYRPFSARHLAEALPATVKSIAVLDRTKEPGAPGEPLHLDIITAVRQAEARGFAKHTSSPTVVGGRYGLSSKEFTPAMVKGVFDALCAELPKDNFTVGIIDDVTFSHVGYEPTYSIERPETFRGMFFGLGADGTVGANKNSIKIIGDGTDLYAQGYFVYDSKKSGAATISHLRFGPDPIRAPYLIDQARFVACHQFVLLERFDVLQHAAEGGVFLLNSPYGPEETWSRLPYETQAAIIEKKLHFYVIDAYSVAREVGLRRRINTVMQTCFFAISEVLPRDTAIKAIKDAIRDTYSKRGEDIVKQNYAAVDSTLAHLHDVSVPDTPTASRRRRAPVPAEAPEFVRDVLGPIIAGRGDELPVSAFPVDGTYPSATARWEQRDITDEIPAVDTDLCIQCGKCVLVCPHAVIRAKVYEESLLDDAPEAFLSMNAKFKDLEGTRFSLQVAPDGCTGCVLCVEACPVSDKENPGRKALNMVDKQPIAEQERTNWEFFQSLPNVDRTRLNLGRLKDTQLLEPLFEFSGACSGCGETAYVKLFTQLFGDRALVANATGCSSIYGGNLPTTPWAMNADGRGPAWSNSLFEDNAEFGLGMRITVEAHNARARLLVPRFADTLGDELVNGLLEADQGDEGGIQDQRDRITAARRKLTEAGVADSPEGKDLLSVIDGLVDRSVWMIGGDGWAYDIGFGGLDHVLASGRNVNILVLDTQVYSNTGGQASKATPRAAIARFAASGKEMPKKDLGAIAMAYGYVYVAQVAMGASDTQTLKAFREAEAYDGPSLILAYSPCNAQGVDMRHSLDQMSLAVDSGAWPLYRFNPDLGALGKNPLKIDSKDPKIPFEEFAHKEGRFEELVRTDPERAKALFKAAQQDIDTTWRNLRHLASLPAEEAR